MSVRSAQSVTRVFTTRRFDTGAASNADSTPTGTLYVNGTADAAAVTVTNVTTGVYKAAVTLPTLAAGDVVDLRIAATVNSVSDNAVIWRDTKDLALDSSYRPGIDWANVGTPGSTVNLSATTVNLTNTVTTYTGNTPQTGDCFARLTGTGAVTLASLTVSGATTLTGAVTASNGSNSITGVTVATNNDKTGYALTSAYDFAKGTAAMTEAYAANGAAMTPVQALHAIHQYLQCFIISGTSYTVKKLDGSTTAFVVALNDATSPTGASR